MHHLAGSWRYDGVNTESLLRPQVDLESLDKVFIDRKPLFILTEFALPLPLWAAAEKAAELATSCDDSLVNELVVRAGNVGEPYLDAGLVAGALST